ncbi:CPTP [Branchiostoma lanceolatum]|uniref:CPTP protein n=1 Tax=Branchiostoma lanceolatum TaxID=7740 RepID=A0A8J9YRJ0_BRALA|nr:CPTP [Branchiostoma lanceolatum]
MNKGSAKIAVSITACLCLTFLLLGLYSGRLTSLKRGEWTGLQDTDETIQSWGGKGQVHINNQQYDIEGRAIRQGGDKGSIKVEAGWHKPHEKMPMAHVTADLKVKVKGDKENSFLHQLTNHRKGEKVSKGSGLHGLPQGDTIGEDGGEGQEPTEAEIAWLEQVERILNGEDIDSYPFRNGKYVWTGSENDSQQKTKQQETNNNDDSPPGCYKNKPDHFSLSRLVESFKNTLTKDGEIDTTKYIDTNNELMKFFPMMGTLFTFVTSEAQNKIDYLMSYLEGPDGKEYKTLSSMVKFETDNHIINIKAYEESGTRNFLRLHRGLNFSLAFCEGLKNSKPGDNIVTIAYDSYSSTVSHFHGWFVRKAIQAAFYLLPSRDTFMGLLCDTDEDTAFKLLNELAEVAKPVYDRTQYVYEKYNYLDLP